MRMLKKLQENWVYWRFRYFTRRWLAVKGWWRQRRQPRTNLARNVVRVRYRGVANNSGVRGGLNDPTRGLAFVLSLAVVWTALAVLALSHDGALLNLIRIASLLLLVALFSRFW